MENYTELHALHTKMKKSLIPIIGKGPSYLFKTATESDLNTIRSNVSRLAKSQDEVACVLDENIFVINITRVEMPKNTQALNK